MTDHNIFERPGYRRCIRVTAVEGVVTAMLEDDLHCMIVRLRHADGVVVAVEPAMPRAPWTTCPGARARLTETFVGRPLHEVTARRDKRANCTHLHDLAVLAAAYADQPCVVQYDIGVSDPIDGERVLALRRSDGLEMTWRERDGAMTAPASMAGLSLLSLRDWIAAQPDRDQEPARLMQWAGLVAHGRTIPLDQQSNAAAMPPSCYTFQPEQAAQAVRVGEIVDFSRGARAPLDGIEM